MAHSLVMGVKFCLEQQISLRAIGIYAAFAHVRTCTIRGERLFPRKCSRFLGANRFTRRCGNCRLHAIWLNQLRVKWAYQKELSSTVVFPRAVDIVQSSKRSAGCGMRRNVHLQIGTDAIPCPCFAIAASRACKTHKEGQRAP